MVRAASNPTKSWLYLNFRENEYWNTVGLRAWLGDSVDGIDRDYFDSLVGKRVRVRLPLRQFEGTMHMRIHSRDDIRVLEGGEGDPDTENLVVEELL